MSVCHLARAESLREVCNGLACCLGKLNHLGIDMPPNKSTLSYSNGHRRAGLSAEVFRSTLGQFRASGQLGAPGKAKCRLKSQLLSLDSTLISLCVSLFPWARCQAKGGSKVQLLLDHDDYMPAHSLVTEGRPADVRIAPKLQLNPGSIVAKNRACNDFELFGTWYGQGVFFVTRMKEGTVYEVVESRPLPAGRPILADDVIRLASSRGRTDQPLEMRRGMVWDEQRHREIVLLTNHLDFDATTILAIYHDRWQIELFFKALKQNLKIRTFVGTSENALGIQIWTALIALLLLCRLHHLSRVRWSLSNPASMLRLNLFTYRDLTDWLDNPSTPSPNSQSPSSSPFDLPGLGQPA